MLPINNSYPIYAEMPPEKLLELRDYAKTVFFNIIDHASPNVQNYFTEYITEANQPHKSKNKDISSEYNKIKKKDNLELEIRLKNITYDTFSKKYLLFLNKDKTFEMSVNFISDSSEVYKQVFSSGLEKIKEEKYTKTKIFSYEDQERKYVLSSENPIEKIKSPFSVFRMKFRSSITINEWRYDFTLIKNLSTENLKETYKSDFKEFFSKSFDDTSDVDNYEIEIEYIGKKNMTKDKISEALSIFDVSSFEEKLSLVTSILNVKGNDVKSIANKVTTLTYEIYKELFDKFSTEDWYITDKADGQRAFLVFDSSGISLLTDTLIQLSDTPENSSIFDVEFLNDSVLIFDVIQYNNELVIDLSFSERLNIINSLDISDPFIKVKKYYLINQSMISEIIETITNDIRSYDIDGFIFTSGSGDYLKTINYKWKPLNKLSIDFYAVKAPKEWFHPVEGYKTYILMSGITEELRKKLSLEFPVWHSLLDLPAKNWVFPIEFTPSGCPNAFIYRHPNSGPEIHKEIVEMTINLPCDIDNQWNFVKIRSERKNTLNDFGNFFQFAELNYQEFMNPLTLDIIKNPTEIAYFAEKTPEMYFEGNNFKRLVISKILEPLRNKNIIMDLGSGRGSEIKKYLNLHIKRCLFVDIDKFALNELIRRKYTSDNGMNINILRADLKEDYHIIRKEIINRFDIRNSDSIVCNFAFHYLCDTYENLRNMINLISSFLQKNGLFIFTVMDGLKVFNKLKHKYLIMENGMIKYNINKLYTEKRLLNVGQMIEVKLPFSSVLYPEPLCNVDFVISEFEKTGFHFVEYDSFDKFINDGKLNKDDIENISLYSYIILEKL